MGVNIPGLDDLDYQILNVLIKDSRTSYLEIARQFHVSGGTIHVRMNKMQEMGLIKGARLIVDTSKLGYDVCCFIGMYLDKASSYPDVLEQLREIKEIVELHYTTGAYSVFIKVICKSIPSLQDLLMNKLQVISGVQSTDTFITLSQPIDRNISL